MNPRRTRPTVLVLAVSVPAIVAAVIGLTHPATLDASTAEHWRNLHIALIPVFPLIGLAPWLVARRGGLWLGRAGAVLGFGFAAFYTSLDLLAGVAGGALVASGFADATGQIFAIARVLGTIGVASLVAGTVVAAVAAYRVAGLGTLPGALLAVVGAVLVQPGHIFLGLGTVAMLLLAGGYVVMAWRVSTSGPEEARSTAPVS